MALDRLLAAARSRSGRTGCAVLLGVVFAAGVVRADDRVYVWRDQDGTVRFSPVQQPPTGTEQASDDTAHGETAEPLAQAR